MNFRYGSFIFSIIFLFLIILSCKKEPDSYMDMETRNIYHFNTEGIENPEAKVLFLEGLKLATNQKFEESFQKIMMANKLEDNNPILINSLGSSIGKLGDKKRAIRMFLKAVEIDSMHYPAYQNLGVEYMRLQEFDEAEKMFLKAEQTVNNTGALAVIWINMAILHYRQKEYKTGLVYAEKAKKFSSNESVTEYIDGIIELLENGL